MKQISQNTLALVDEIRSDGASPFKDGRRESPIQSVPDDLSWLNNVFSQ